MKYQKPKGTKDILPGEMHKWHFVERTVREVMGLYDFSEIRTPTFEKTELFTRGIGTDTDIVGKEMYTFTDKSGNSLTLRPEMTANVIRAYIENGLAAESPVHKLYYIANMYRHEKPQAGRYREHTQFGAELIGSDDIHSDIELVVLAKEIYNRVGVHNFKVRMNSLGKAGERRKYLDVLKSYLSKHLNELSEDSRRRFTTNPLRIFDSKERNDVEVTEDAPKLLEHLEPESRNRFDSVLNGLTKLGITYEYDFRLVRGFDYYTDTTFEFVSDKLGTQDAIGGGGRYDGLVEQLGGKPTPGAGFGSGIERVIMAAEGNDFEFPQSEKLTIYLATSGEPAKELAMKLALELRRNNIGCETDLLGRSLKSQMREANKLGSRYVVIIGDDEIKRGVLLLKNMSDGSQSEIPGDTAVNHLIKLK